MRRIAFLVETRPARRLVRRVRRARRRDRGARRGAARAEEGLVLDADFAFELTPRLAEVVANGVPLYFRVEFELTRRRWYWFDETAAVAPPAAAAVLSCAVAAVPAVDRAAAAELREPGGSAERAQAGAQLAGGRAQRHPRRPTTRLRCACASTRRCCRSRSSSPRSPPRAAARFAVAALYRALAASSCRRRWRAASRQGHER